MAKDAKELLAGFLSSTLKLDEAGVASLYNEDGTVKDDALTSLLAKDSDRVKNLKPDTKKIADDQYKRGVREAMEKFESELKDKTGFDSELKGIELVLAYAETKTTSTADVTDEAVKKSPLFISTVDKLKKEKNEAVKKSENELADFKKSLSVKETFSKISAKAQEIFTGLKPILSKDTAKAKIQIEDFVAKLNSFKYDIQGERIVVLKEDGSPHEDEHGHAIEFDKLVKQTAERYYDFLPTDPTRKSTENGKDKDGKPVVKKEIKVPQNDKEYAAMLMDQKISVEDKTEIQKAYKQKTEPAAV